MFDVENLSCVCNNAKIGKVPAVWVYFNEAADEVTSAGFIPSTYGMRAKDQVIVVDASGESNKWYHATMAEGKITLVANA